MSARKKLNTIYLILAAIASLTVGFVSGSFAVFVISFGLITACLLHDGSIRPERRRR